MHKAATAGDGMEGPQQAAPGMPLHYHNQLFQLI